jgi:hypothetical protein
MFVAAWGGTKWFYSIETPHSEGPRWRDGVQGLGWQVLLLRTMCGSRTGGWSLPGVMSD